MIEYLRQQHALRLIAKAIEEHNRFEYEHRLLMARLLTKSVDEDHRTVQIGDKITMVRPLGSYDIDQKIERIANEIIRMLHAQRRRPPKALHRMIGDAL